MSKLKTWLCSHGIHWYMYSRPCVGNGWDIVCTWCGHVRQDDYMDELDFKHDPKCKTKERQDGVPDKNVM